MGVQRQSDNPLELRGETVGQLPRLAGSGPDDQGQSLGATGDLGDRGIGRGGVGLRGLGGNGDEDEGLLDDKVTAFPAPER